MENHKRRDLVRPQSEGTEGRVPVHHDAARACLSWVISEGSGVNAVGHIDPNPVHHGRLLAHLSAEFAPRKVPLQASFTGRLVHFNWASLLCKEFESLLELTLRIN